MAVDLDHLRETADSFRSMPPESKAIYTGVLDVTFGRLKKELPALNVTDLGAVAWYIASMVSAIRMQPVCHIGDTLRDTSFAYLLGAARAYGFVRDEDIPDASE